MSVIVSDTSPVRALAHLGLLSVLQKMFGRVVVPRSVAMELFDPPSRYQSIDVSSYDFFEIVVPADQRFVTRLTERLDLGEAEAIAVAVEMQAVTLLIDESAGRQVAMELGLSPLGTIGLLLRAKQSRLCGNIAPLLDSLRSDLRFHLSDSLYELGLRLAGE